MEKDDPEREEKPSERAVKMLEWFDNANFKDLDFLMKIIEENNLCINRTKVEHLEMTWKKEVSENPTTLKYREPETGMYYETDDIMEYIQDCRQRKQAVSTEDIIDFEMIHKDRPQKVFFWVPVVYEHLLGEFQDKLDSWLAAKFEGDSRIVAHNFQDRYIIVCQNVVAKNREEKIMLIREFIQSVPAYSDLLSAYLIKSPEIFEEIPSITNADYKTDPTIQLLKNNYVLRRAVFNQIKDLATTETSGVTINIIIENLTIAGTINNYAEDSPYRRFVNHIKTTKPDWYVPGEWIPKQTLVDEYNTFTGSDINLRELMKHLKLEGLFTEISEGEKRSRMNGGRTRLFLAK